MLKDSNGKEINTIDAFITRDPIIVLVYLLMVKVVPIGMMVSIVNDIVKNKDKEYVIQEKELGEFTKKLLEGLY